MEGHVLFEMELHSWENNERYAIVLEERVDSWVFSRNDIESGLEFVELKFSHFGALGVRTDVLEVLTEMSRSNPAVFTVFPFCTLTVEEDAADNLVAILNVFTYLEDVTTTEEIDFELYRPFWKEYRRLVVALSGNELYKVQVGENYWVVVNAGERSSVLPGIETIRALDNSLATWSVVEGAQSWQVSSSKLIKFQIESEEVYVAVDTQEEPRFSLINHYSGSSVFSDAEAIFDWLNELETRWVGNGFFASDALVTVGIRKKFQELAMESNTRLHFKSECTVSNSLGNRSLTSAELDITFHDFEDATFEVLSELLFFGRDYLLEVEERIESVGFLNFYHGSNFFESISFQRNAHGVWASDANMEVSVNGITYYFPLHFKTLYSLWGQSHSNLVTIHLKEGTNPNLLPKYLRLRRDNNPYRATQFYVDGVQFSYPLDLPRSSWA
jgi:hypothetical protein